MATAVQDVNREPTLEEILKDFPSSPLDLYRKRASFDWKRMKLFIDGEDVLKFKVKVNGTKYVTGTDFLISAKKKKKKKIHSYLGVEFHFSLIFLPDNNKIQKSSSW